jgi:hypothetical protein
MIRKLPKDGSIRRKRAFAWLPVKTYDGYHLWFEYYTQVEQYWSYKNMWVLQERLSRGSKVMANGIEYEVRVDADGDKHWYLNGERHREDGPAVEFSGGNKAWYLNGKLHREDGPAVEYEDGRKYWYLNDECLTEEEFNERMTPTVELTMAQISEALGKNVKVVK